MEGTKDWYDKYLMYKCFNE